MPVVLVAVLPHPLCKVNKCEKRYLFEEAQVDLDEIISRLGISSNVALCKFLRTAQRLILEDDFDGL